MLRPIEASSPTRSMASAGATRFVQVKAPATLNEGYIFWAEIDNTSFPVRVPHGGVKSEQRLLVPLLDKHCVPHNKGQWKDGLFSCFKFGLCHPHLCNAWLCPQILLGQILTRMKMTWLAQPTNSKSGLQVTFRRILVCLIFFSLYDAFVAPPLFEFTVDDKGELNFQQSDYSLWHQVSYVLLTLPMTIYGFVVVVRLRAAIRSTYGIPTGRLGFLEDICCVCCCNCCVMSQMARQTADYDDEPASFCSKNGMRRPSLAAFDEEAVLPASSLDD